MINAQFLHNDDNDEDLINEKKIRKKSKNSYIFHVICTITVVVCYFMLRIKLLFCV